jgi:hypothetical protein
MQAESAPDIGIFSFPNELVTEDQGFSWAMVETAGAGFLRALERFIEENEVSLFTPLTSSLILIQKLNDCPIFVAAHSTGGIILKRVSYLKMLSSRAVLADLVGFVY